MTMMTNTAVAMMPIELTSLTMNAAFYMMVPMVGMYGSSAAALHTAQRPPQSAAIARTSRHSRKTTCVLYSPPVFFHLLSSPTQNLSATLCGEPMSNDRPKVAMLWFISCVAEVVIPAYLVAVGSSYYTSRNPEAYGTYLYYYY